MKQIILSVIALFMATTLAWGNQTQDSVISVIIDYEHGYYVDYTYMQMQQEKPSFMRARALFAAKFLEGVTAEYHGQLKVLGEDVEPERDDATLTLTIKYVDLEGFIDANIEYQKGKVYHRRSIRSKYSPFGTWMGNFGEGMLSLGEQVGKWLTADFK